MFRSPTGAEIILWTFGVVIPIATVILILGLAILGVPHEPF